MEHVKQYKLKYHFDIANKFTILYTYALAAKDDEQ